MDDLSGISPTRLDRLNGLIAAGTPEKFYSWSAWRRRKSAVLRLDNWECQRCKALGRYQRAEIVHHVKHLTDRPDLALSVWDGEERQLISVCKRCHEQLHPEGQRQFAPRPAPLTDERWD